MFDELLSTVSDAIFSEIATPATMQDGSCVDVVFHGVGQIIEMGNGSAYQTEDPQARVALTDIDKFIIGQRISVRGNDFTIQGIIPKGSENMAIVQLTP